MNKNRLFRLLIVSGLLNVVLAFFIAFQILSPFSLQRNIPFSKKEGSLAPLTTNLQTIKAFEGLSYARLVAELGNSQMVEEGYSFRDLALTVLQFKYKLDVGRAFANRSLQSRNFSYGDKKLTLYAGLQTKDFEDLQAFLQKEKYPFTTEGLFYLLKEKKGHDCLRTFIQSQEFLVYETLFRRAHSVITRKDLLDLILEGNWEIFKKGFDLLESTGDFSAVSRQKILSDYLELKSPKGALLLLQMDCAFAINCLSDPAAILLLSLVDPNLQEGIFFAKGLLESKRSDLCLEKAKNFLKVEEGEVAAKESPRPGIGKLRPLFRDPTPKAPAPRMHVIQNGESLWSISKRYDVSLEALLQYNNLSGTTVQPGQTLHLPP